VTTIGVLVGNPKPLSRTYEAANLLAEMLTGQPPGFRIDLAQFGPALLEPENDQIERSLAQICGSDILIVASPTYKGTYSGLLKVYLDRIPAEGLRGIVAAPVMLAAAPEHALAADLLLKPVLVQLGAICPVPGLFVPESDYARLSTIETWLGHARRTISLYAADR
jgi:FMN reductase